MKAETIINITESGEIEWIGDQCPFDDLPLGKIRRRRLSTIQPTQCWKRVAFLTLRLLCGDRGPVAAFTRTWSGPWRVTILATGETAVFESRADAVGWEIETINGHLPNIDL